MNSHSCHSQRITLHVSNGYIPTGHSYCLAHQQASKTCDRIRDRTCDRTCDKTCDKTCDRACDKTCDKTCDTTTASPTNTLPLGGIASAAWGRR